MKKMLLGLYAVAIHAALIAVLVWPRLITHVRVHAGIEARGAGHIESMRWYHSFIDDVVPEGSAVFLGDSNTQSMPTFLVEPNSINLGIGSLKADQLASELPNYSAIRRAGRIYLSIGTNDVRDGEGDALPHRFVDILEAIPSDVPLIWSSVIPRLPENESTIRAANKEAQALCSARPGCFFIDTWQFLADQNGNARSELYRDRIHVNTQGHLLWSEHMRQASQHLHQ